jgi:multidrug efflux pump
VRLSDLSIQRPVLATVMSLLIVVAGAVSFFALPVREYPDVDNPLVSVTTVYPGASPETVEATITEPLERVMNGIEGIRSIVSRSEFGVSGIATSTSPPPTCPTSSSGPSTACRTRPGGRSCARREPTADRSSGST